MALDEGYCLTISLSVARTGSSRFPTSARTVDRAVISLAWHPR